MNTQTLEASVSILHALEHAPRVYRPEPEVLTLIDRMLWKPIEFKSL